MSNDRTGRPACRAEMNGLRWHRVSNTMPNRKKSVKRAQKKRTVKNNKSANGDIKALTKMVAAMQKPSSQVTDLGRMLLHGGNMLGGLIGLPTIFGSGSYDIKQNNLWTAEGQVPFMHSANESFTMRHREFITNVSMAGATFTPRTFDINPGLATTFPYLSNIATNFQEYEFKGLVFEYKSTSSVALSTGTNTAMGVVMMAVQYRTDAPAFTNKQQLLNTMWSVDTPPSSKALLPVECAPEENPFNVQYVRNETVTPGDPKLYDLGQLVVATEGGQAGQTNVVGELWVSYEVCLKKPIQFVDPDLFGFFATMESYSDTRPLGDIPVTIVDNTLGIVVDNVSSPNTITWPAGTTGTFIVMLDWEGTSVAGCSHPTLNNTNFIIGTTVHRTNTPAGPGVNTVVADWFICTVNNPTLPSVISVSGDGILPGSAGVNFGRMWVSRAPSGFSLALF